jgi:hypothetical protein
MALTPEERAARDAARAAEASLSILERIQKYRTRILELQTKEGELSSAESDELYKQEILLAKNIAIQEKRAKRLLGTKQVELDIANAYAQQADGLSSISKVYKGLTDVQKQSLVTVQSSLSSVQASLIADENKKVLLDSTLTGISELQGLQQKMAETGPEDVETQKSISTAYDAQLNKLREAITVKESIGEITEAEANALLASLDTQQNSLAAAQKYGTITKETKELIEAQIQAYEGVKKSIRGVLGTLSMITKGPMGALGVGLLGAGFAADKLGKNIRSFGGFIDSAQFSALGLSFIFDDAEETAKSLSKEFGGLKDVTFSTQLNTNLMATNMGISGNEAASIVGSFARMNDGSASTAMDMAATTKEMAKAAGVPVDQVMKDVAGSAQAFAEYGKDGGLNIAKAAVSAAKLGVGMDSLTKVTDSLLDFETSINSELELGAMLGRNINLDRARALAYEGNIGGAVKETLQSLGGIEEFNKMDIFQKRKAAELLGLSVEEFQKMAANSDKLNDDGTVQVSTFNQITEAITASATASGGFLKTMGGLVLGAAQMGGSFAQMGMDVKGMASGALDKIKGFFGGAKPPIPTPDTSITGPLTKDGLPDKRFKANRLPTTPATPPSPTTMAPQAQTGPADQANKMSKIKSGDLIKGAVALLILAAALFVAAKAFQEFGEVTWESVGMGLVALAGLAGIAFILSKAQGAMLQGAVAVAVLGAALIPFAFAMSLIENLKIDAVLAAAAGLVMFGLAAAGIGMILPLILAGSVGIAALGASMILFGAGLMLVSGGMGAISAVIPFVTEQISALSQIDFLPILGLAGALTILSIALAAVAVTGMMALPALLALGLIAGGAAAIMGGGEGESGDRTGELIDEIKGLRADLIAGKIAVNIDGQKVTSNVGKVVSRISSNSYAKV